MRHGVIFRLAEGGDKSAYTYADLDGPGLPVERHSRDPIRARSIYVATFFQTSEFRVSSFLEQVVQLTNNRLP